MLKNYINYLNFIDGKLHKFFDMQKAYIFCKKGCGLCCKNAEFPYYKIELQYLILGARLLDLKSKNSINNNIKKILNEKSKFNDKNFKYNCPFLINNKCSVYEYRGIICRAFGLINIGQDGRFKVPFCCFKGFNYSSVIEEDSNIISAEKYKQLGVKEVPSAFNVNYNFLTDTDFEKIFKFKFGDKKPLINWFLDEKYTLNEKFPIQEQSNKIFSKF